MNKYYNISYPATNIGASIASMLQDPLSEECLNAVPGSMTGAVGNGLRQGIEISMKKIEIIGNVRWRATGWDAENLTTNNVRVLVFIDHMTQGLPPVPSGIFVEPPAGVDPTLALYNVEGTESRYQILVDEYIEPPSRTSVPFTWSSASQTTTSTEEGEGAKLKLLTDTPSPAWSWVEEQRIAGTIGIAITTGNDAPTGDIGSHSFNGGGRQGRFQNVETTTTEFDIGTRVSLTQGTQITFSRPAMTRTFRWKIELGCVAKFKDSDTENIESINDKSIHIAAIAYGGTQSECDFTYQSRLWYDD